MWGYFLRPSYDSPTGHFHVRYTDLGDRFGDNINAVGFVRDDNRRELDSALENPWPSQTTIPFRSYDTAPDGTLVARTGGENERDTYAVDSIHLILDFAGELRRRFGDTGGGP